MSKNEEKIKLKRFHQAKWDEPIILEMGSENERGILLPKIDEEVKKETEQLVPENMTRSSSPNLPEMSQMQVLRHYLRLSQETIGADFDIDIGLGTCTMKYNPKIHEKFANSPKIADLHPYQDEDTVQGILKVLYKTEKYLKEISGMDKFSFQPSGGTQAIFSNVSAIRAYHEDNGEGDQRDEIITTMYSHPGNPGVASTLGYKVINLMPDEEKGYPDIEALKEAVSERTAALLITNPEDTGIFNTEIKEFVDIVHEAGGLCVYDQANANGLMGITRAKEAGFDMMHFNLHKTFSSPHGSQGPACGAQGVLEKYAKYLPNPKVKYDGENYYLDYNRPNSIGKLRKFYGVPPVVLRAYAYIRTLGAEGLKEVSKLAVLNNNYMMEKLLEIPGLNAPYAEGKRRVEQVRYSWKELTDETGVTTDDINNRVVDYGLQNYFPSHHPRIVPEPFTPEPVETYSKEDIDEYVAIIKKIAEEAYDNPDIVKNAPHNSTLAGQIKKEYLTNMDKFACTWRAYKNKE